MKIDANAFPIITMQYNTPEPLQIDLVLDQLSELIARDRPFVFVAQGGLGDSRFDANDHKKLTLWMKNNKAEIVKNIKAHVHVVTSDTEQKAANDFAPTFFKFWGYPMFTAGTTEEAHRMALELLTN